MQNLYFRAETMSIVSNWILISKWGDILKSEIEWIRLKVS